MFYKVNIKLTGNYKLKKKLFGGYVIYVEESYQLECIHDFSQGPVRTYFRKAKYKDIENFKLILNE